MSLNEDQVLEILQKVGAFRTGHFVLTSGLHGDSYVLKDAMYAYPREISQVCRETAERFADDNVEAVIGPAIGAAILSQWVAYHLAEIYGREVYSVFAEKDSSAKEVNEEKGLPRLMERLRLRFSGTGGGFIIKRGYDKVIAGKRVLVVEDITTTGGSIRKVVEAARVAGAKIVGVTVIANRGEVTKEMIGNPPKFISLVNLAMEQWPAGECELCQKNIPVNTDIGHGREFLAGGR